MSHLFVVLLPRTVTRKMFAVQNSFVKENVKGVTNDIPSAKTMFLSTTHAQKQRKLPMFAMGVPKRADVDLISIIIVPQELIKNTRLFL